VQVSTPKPISAASDRLQHDVCVEVTSQTVERLAVDQDYLKEYHFIV
jgi:hypothetical protein